MYPDISIYMNKTKWDADSCTGIIKIITFAKLLSN